MQVGPIFLCGPIMNERSAEIGDALARLLAKQANFLCQTQPTFIYILDFEQSRKRTLELFRAVPVAKAAP